MYQCQALNGFNLRKYFKNGYVEIRFYKCLRLNKAQPNQYNLDRKGKAEKMLFKFFENCIGGAASFSDLIARYMY